MTKQESIPTTEQLSAIVDFASANGRYWKAVLRDVWMAGGYNTETGKYISGPLMQLRNSFGPSWLTSLSLKQVDEQLMAGRRRQQLLDESVEFQGMRRNGEV